MELWKTEILKAWKSQQAKSDIPRREFPLIEQSFDDEDICAMAEVIVSGQLTMAQRVREFEARFAEFVGAPYAVMVNSGSSANLLAMAVLCNPDRCSHFKLGDEVLVPAVCWSTSVWPLIQFGLKPVFVDVSSNTLNMSIEDAESKITARTRGMVCVHILGNSVDMDGVSRLQKKHNLLVMEDTCESLGSSFGTQKLGTLGAMGTYSFYFSHHANLRHPSS